MGDVRAMIWAFASSEFPMDGRRCRDHDQNVAVRLFIVVMDFSLLSCSSGQTAKQAATRLPHEIQSVIDTAPYLQVVSKVDSGCRQIYGLAIAYDMT